MRRTIHRRNLLKVGLGLGASLTPGAVPRKARAQSSIT